MQSGHGGRNNLSSRLFRHRNLGSATLDVGRRRQLAHRRGLTLRAMHQLPLALNAKCVTRSKPAFEAVSVIAEKIEDYHACG
jgi:hypothetical protein